jgi:hypothetical protein
MPVSRFPEVTESDDQIYDEASQVDPDRLTQHLRVLTDEMRKTALSGRRDLTTSTSG